MKQKDIKQYVTNYGRCLATKLITQKGKSVNYMYREDPDNDSDSEWRFFSGFETDDYVNDSKNIEVFRVLSRILNLLGLASCVKVKAASKHNSESCLA